MSVRANPAVPLNTQPLGEFRLASYTLRDARTLPFFGDYAMAVRIRHALCCTLLYTDTDCVRVGCSWRYAPHICRLVLHSWPRYRLTVRGVRVTFAVS